MMLRTLKRELFIRWVRIEHDKWYEKMVKTVFGTKTEMRYVLSLKKTMYNAWSEYCRMMKLPFSECHNFWRLLDDGAKQTLIKHAKKHTLEGSEERRQLELALAEYPHSGPMGSQDPKLPVDVVHLERILSDENANLQEKWKKKTCTPGQEHSMRRRNRTNRAGKQQLFWAGSCSQEKSAARARRLGPGT